MEKLHNIAVFRIGGIGDVITATPVLRSLREAHPNSHITLFAEETPARLIRPVHWVDEIITDDKIYRCQSLVRLCMPDYLYRMYRLRRKIRSRNYDLYIELHRLIRWKLVLKPFLFARFTRADRRVGLNTYNRGFFLTDPVSDDPTRVKSQVHWFGDVLRKLEVPFDSLRPEIPLPSDMKQNGKALLESVVTTGETIVGFFLGANPEFPEKYWPVEYFVELAHRLSKTHNVSILAFAGPEEMDRVSQFEDRIDGDDPIFALRSSYSIMTVAGLIDQLDYLVSADTGPMHMGVALETPTLGIFGPSEWHWYGTYPEDFGFVRAGPPCSENTSRKKPDRFTASLEDVTVSDVLEQFDKLRSLSS